jgi:hypothetical protein
MFVAFYIQVGSPMLNSINLGCERNITGNTAIVGISKEKTAFFIVGTVALKVWGRTLFKSQRLFSGK